MFYNLIVATKDDFKSVLFICNTVITKIIILTIIIAKSILDEYLDEFDSLVPGWNIGKLQKSLGVRQ